ncbi:MAG: hypothetical protein WAQ98_25720 [Blastocatellia bacterium]
MSSTENKAKAHEMKAEIRKGKTVFLVTREGYLKVKQVIIHNGGDITVKTYIEKTYKYSSEEQRLEFISVEIESEMKYLISRRENRRK